MKICLMPGGSPLYIQLRVYGNGDMMLRRWPWPHSLAQRKMHLDEAVAYARRLADTLECPCEIHESITADCAPESSATRQRRRTRPAMPAKELHQGAD